ncbi:hypothetical protein BS50DRAFT_618756 [Corynespora cassiicola Philippines]|uniref:Rhodopsin domain-containing protein n=1 Tax=Corynespora cassiicola Philippines TaxID=1448308 RepID=A0A2T2NWH9_CORCC|nr:hypothetical protein BS50DRAFT_618756 [Corynespora cassiicola Philippines]
MTASPNIPLEKDDTYLPEVWTWYAIGVVFIALRCATRLRTVGIRNYQGDDYLAMLLLLLWTCNAIIVQITYYTGGNLDVRPDMVEALSDRDIEILTWGSQLEFASWYTYPGTIWTLKFMVLFFYRRLTLGALRRRTLRVLFWSCGISYVILCLTVSLSCRPYSHNWQIRPLPGPHCTFRPQNFYVLVVLNVLTDTALLIIPAPILWRLRVSLTKKLGVTLLLSSGLFIIGTAVVRAIVTIRSPPSVININRWGFRETGVGLVTVMLPILAPMGTRGFWRRGPYRRYPSVYEGTRKSDDERERLGDMLKTVDIEYAFGHGYDPSIPQHSSWRKGKRVIATGGEDVWKRVSVTEKGIRSWDSAWGKYRDEHGEGT